MINFAHVAPFLTWLMTIVSSIAFAMPSYAEMIVERTRCDSADNPLGVVRPAPRLSWQLRDNRFGARQTAYRILVATDPAVLQGFDTESQEFAGVPQIAWDSGKVESDQSIHISYQGRPLRSRERLYWRVRVWDADGQGTSWSEIAWFEIGMLNADDWTAKWIEAPPLTVTSNTENTSVSPLMRHSFKVAGGVASARAYVCGLGYSEFYLNGKKVGKHVLEPAQTDYFERAFYSIYDVTDFVNQGENVVGLWLGNGWFNQTEVYGHWAYGKPCGILQLEVVYEDGRTERIETDQSWQVASSPVVSNNVHLGETYDARLEQVGWPTTDFDASSWRPAIERKSPTKSLQVQAMPAIQRIEEISSVSVSEPESGKYVVDMGQNFAGWVKLKIAGQTGQVIDMKFAEALTPDGRIDQRSTGIFQSDRYICRGGIEEVWEPRFTYHGFRYVEISGFKTLPTLETLTGVVVHTAVKSAGQFTCSDPLINRIHKAAMWTQRSNLHGVPTDCPHRERCGWLGDTHVAAEMMIYNFDVELFLNKYIHDIRTSLIDEVTPRYVAPGQGNPGPASADWASALIQLPWYLYVYYGDQAALEDHYEMGSRWLKHVRENLLDEQLILQGTQWGEALGDWCPPGGNDLMKTPKPLTSTAYVYLDHRWMAMAAKVLNKQSDADFLEKFADQMKTHFNQKFYEPVQRSYGTQTANAVALYCGLAPSGAAESIAQSLADDIRLAGGHHSTGILGSRYLFGELSRYGFGDVAIGILLKEDYPSVGWLFQFGATTLWENWADGMKPGDPMPDYSLNQPMQGGFDAWFYDGLCGIQPDSANPGFKHFFLRPCCPTQLQFADASHDSPHGRIESKWKREQQQMKLQFTVPANTTATVYPPFGVVTDWRINGKVVREAEGVIRVDSTNNSITVGAGLFSFVTAAD